MKKTIIFFITIIICLFIGIATTFCSRNIIPYFLNIHYETFYSSKIPSEMDNISIVYFSDLLYGQFTPTETVDKTFKKIKELKPDILIFGGDLFDGGFSPSDEDMKSIRSFFNKIEAPLGKFAVYGDADLDPIHREKIDDLFYKCNIEVIHNTNLKIGNRSKKSIRLVNLTESSDNYMDSLSQEEFNLLIVHQPDKLVNESLSLIPIDYALAGNSHGTQITYPIYGGYKTFEGSQILDRYQKETLSFPYYITTGIGCTKIQARFNSTPEVCYFVLRSS